MSGEPLDDFVSTERKKQQQGEELDRQRQLALARRQRMAAALRPLLSLLPLPGPNAEPAPFTGSFRQRLCNALLTAGEKMCAEGYAPAVTALAVRRDAHGFALGLLQRAARGDQEGVAQDLAKLAGISDAARQEVWQELRSLADQLLEGWLDTRLALQQAPASALTASKEQEQEVLRAPCDQSEAGQVEESDGPRFELKDREKEVLRAMLILKATSKLKARPRLQVARKADPGSPPSSYFKAIASLTKNGLAESKKGPNGGVWLTSEGVSAAKALEPPAGMV
jgi:hypothetical protein